MKNLPPRFARLSHILTTTVLSTSLGMTVFEVAKACLLPNLSIWQAHLITIVFTALFTTVVAYLVLRKLPVLVRQRQSQWSLAEQIVNQATDGIMTINKRGQVLSLNPAAEQLFGYPGPEVLNQSITKLLTDTPQQERQSLLHGSLPAGTILGLAASAREVIGKRKNGDTISLEMTGSGMVQADEPVSVAFLRDVSKRKRAQRYLIAHYAATCILAESDSLALALPRILQVVCEALHWEAGAFWSFDRQAGVSSCTEVYQAPFAALPPWPESGPLTCQLGEGLPGRVWATGKSIWVEDLRITKDSLCQALAVPLRLHGAFAFPILQGKEVLGVLTFFNCRKQKRDEQLLDIMVEFGKQLGHFIASKQGEEKLRETTQTLQALVQAAPVAIHIVDLEGKVQLWNPAAERIFGWTEAEILGKSLPLLREGEPEEAAGKPSLGSQRQSAHGLPIRCRRKDGAGIEASLSTAPLRNTLGNVFGVMGIRMDLTEQKQLEDQLRQAQKMEAVGQLAGGVAHDFNNLLTVITGYSEILLQDLKPEDPGRMFLEHIHKAGERAAGLTRQLLAFSRKSILQPCVLDLNELVANVQMMLGRLIGEDIQLFTTLAPVLGRVKADPGQIEQILVNLAVNARDAMPTGGKFIVETLEVEIDEVYARAYPELRPGHYAMLAVSDTGCGMDKQTLARIFEPFFTTKEVGKGTGLGLATVYGIAKQSGGHVTAYSEVGKGATFQVYLPIVREDSARYEDGNGPLSAPGGNETVLLVEDEGGVRALTRQVLQSNGYTVLDANDGEEALRVTEKTNRSVDLLLTDVVMPHLGGRALAKAITSRFPKANVLYMSGYTNDAVIRNGVLESENAFLQKPFTMNGLLRKVREVLDTNKGMRR